MTTSGTVQLLFVALAVIMAGLGLSLEIADFRRVFTKTRPIAIGLGLQMLVLPVFAFALATAMHLPATFAVGLMLLAAAPGSISSNLYSHIFGGNLALSMSLTGINTLISIFTIPFVCGWAQEHFAGASEVAPAVAGNLLEVMAMLSVPVVVGMVIRAKSPRFAAAADKPIRIFSVIVLVVFSAAAIFNEWKSLTEAFSQVGLSVAIFNVFALVLGFRASRAMRLDHSSSVAVTFHLGVRSAVLSIYVAMTVLQSPQAALPAAVYSITMVLFALGFGLWIRRNRVAVRSDSSSVAVATAIR